MSTLPPDIPTAAADIAAQLQETHPPAILQIRRIVEQIGLEAAYVCLQKALAVEANGGMLTADNKQRRTPGGAYFYIVRGQLTPEQRCILWPRTKRACFRDGCCWLILLSSFLRKNPYKLLAKYAEVLLCPCILNLTSIYLRFAQIGR